MSFKWALSSVLFIMWSSSIVHALFFSPLFLFPTLTCYHFFQYLYAMKWIFFFISSFSIRIGIFFITSKYFPLFYFDYFYMCMLLCRYILYTPVCYASYSDRIEQRRIHQVVSYAHAYRLIFYCSVLFLTIFNSFIQIHSVLLRCIHTVWIEARKRRRRDGKKNLWKSRGEGCLLTLTRPIAKRFALVSNLRLNVVEFIREVPKWVFSDTRIVLLWIDRNSSKIVEIEADAITRAIKIPGIIKLNIELCLRN